MSYQAAAPGTPRARGDAPPPAPEGDGEVETRARSAALHGEILGKYDLDAQAENDNRLEQQDDMLFRAGKQWPSTIEQERVAEGRPIVTINRTGQYVRQVTGDLRKNPPSIRVRPVGGGADPKVARALSGLLRKIERNSDGQAAYINAVDHAASGGIGHWRILTQYAQWDAFDQDIVIEPIANPFAVTWDRLALKPTREDARHCTVTEWLDVDAFAEKYPDASEISFDDQSFLSQANGSWFSDNCVRIAEHFWKVPEERLLAQLRGGAVVDVTELGEPELQQLPITRFRLAVVDAVWWCKLNGVELLEKPRKWPGRHIPIVPVIGEEIHTGETISRRGIIRDLKDPARLYNYTRSAQAELVALQPKSPFIATRKQVQMHWDMWKQANRRNYPVLIYDVDPQAPNMVPQRVQPPVASGALSEMAAMASEDMKGATGIYDAALGARSNETSGVAIRARQAEGDTGTFVYSDNLARSMTYSARIILDLVPHIYDTERTTRIFHEDGTDEEVTLNQTIMVGGEPVVLYDVTMGKWDVEVTIGPTYATRRAESVESMMEFIRVLPGAASVVADLIAKNSDWPGAETIARRLRKLVPAPLLEGEPNDEDQGTPAGGGQQLVIGPDGQIIPASQGGQGAPDPSGAASAPGGAAAGPGPDPRLEAAEKDAKLGIESAKVDNDAAYKEGTLENDRRRIAIEAWNALMTTKERMAKYGLELAENERAQLAQLEELAAESGMPDQMGAGGEGDEMGESSPAQMQPATISDLVAQVGNMTQAIGQLAGAIAQGMQGHTREIQELQALMIAPRKVVVSRGADGSIAGATQVPILSAGDAIAG